MFSRKAKAQHVAKMAAMTIGMVARGSMTMKRGKAFLADLMRWMKPAGRRIGRKLKRRNVSQSNPRVYNAAAGGYVYIRKPGESDASYWRRMDARAKKQAGRRVPSQRAFSRMSGH